MARNPNVRSRQVVKFYTTGARASATFGLPDYLRGVVKRYGAAKVAAVNVVSGQAVALANAAILQTYTVPPTELADRLRTANTPDTFRLFASSLRFPLSLFNGQWGGHTSAGASAEVLRGQSKTYTHSFIAPGRYRGRTIPMIYSRVDGKKVLMKHGRYEGKLREPIIALRGPSTYQMATGFDSTGRRSRPALNADLGDQLRALYLAEVNKRFAASEGTNG